MSSYLVPFFSRFARLFSLSLSLALSPSRSLPLSLSFFFWAACLVEVEDEDKGELQQKRFAEAEREWDRARHREKHRLWDREGLLASPFSSSCQFAFLWKERRKEKREEESTCSSYLVLAPPSSLPPEPVSLALYLLIFFRHEEKHRLHRPWEGEGLLACPSFSPFRQEHNLERRGAVAFLSFYSLRKRKYRKKWCYMYPKLGGPLLLFL